MDDEQQQVQRSPSKKKSRKHSSGKHSSSKHKSSRGNEEKEPISEDNQTVELPESLSALDASSSPSKKKKRRKIPTTPPLNDQDTGQSGYQLPSTYSVPKPRASSSAVDDASVVTQQTTFTQVSNVSKLSIRTRKPVLDDEDPLVMDIAQKIQKSQQPAKPASASFIPEEVDKVAQDFMFDKNDEDSTPLDNDSESDAAAASPPRRSAKEQPDLVVKSSFFHSNRKIILLAIGVVILFAVIAGIAVGVTWGGSSAPDSQESVGANPTAAPTTLEESFRTSITNALISQAATLGVIDWEPDPETVTWMWRNLEEVPSPDVLLQTCALLAIFQEMGGESWSQKNDWLFPNVPECDWFGIGCDSNSKVTSLVLKSNQVNGSLPLELGFLTTLNDLELNDNQIQGSLPTTMSLLTSLRDLLLSKNELEGSLSAVLPTSLQVLEIESNSLAGELPNEVFIDLTQLERLYLGYNDFSGRLPPSLGRLTMLTALTVQNNAFTGSLENVDLLALTSLYYLWTSNNAFTGTIPEFLKDVSNLRWLLLDHNNLQGTLPAALGNLSRLQRMQFGKSNLTGTLPVDWSNLRSLELLHLEENGLTGTIPEAYGSLISLSDLNLENNFLSGSIPSQLGALPFLLFMDVSVNGLTGTMPEQICVRDTPLLMLVADCESELNCTCCTECK